MPSVYQVHSAYYANKVNIDKSNLLLKKNEVVCLQKLCNIIARHMATPFQILDGYYVGFSIPQIANEFDLLRFGANYIVNIELKSKLPEDRKIKTIHTQMSKHHYYLKFLEKPLKIYTYIEDDGFYWYNSEKDSVELVNTQHVIDTLINQHLNTEMDPDKLFRPSNYLVSPFNKVEQFIAGEYFLTTDQAKKKKEILESIDKNEYLFFCISADAGTGKTLLTYDIAKTYQQQGKSVLILHCATLNEGQAKLICEHKWNIHPASHLQFSDVSNVIGKPDLIIVDEAHRIWENQLEELVFYANENEISIIFSYDPKQYLKLGEDKDIYSYLMCEFPSKTSEPRKLTKRIRTNKSMASFIKNMFAIGSSKDNLNYENITIEYFDYAQDAKDYLNYLEQTCDWKTITFTSSLLASEPIDSLSCLCEKKAHNVIGQEFDKVAFAMDSNFQYSANNSLAARRSYYNPQGMLYQIATRAVNELKIIVINNPELYEKLTSIKYMGGQI